ncbi:MAG: DUF2523 domain-containing protein [Ramlibacter sp.]|nr:DUF2523 domain-containing protein [Ramlibacter sp.]
MKLGAWLLAMCEPLIARILLSLGVSVVSVVGFEALVGQAKALFLDKFSGLPIDMLNLFLYLGGGQALGMILGAYTVRVTLSSIGTASRFFAKTPG